MLKLSFNVNNVSSIHGPGSLGHYFMCSSLSMTAVRICVILASTQNSLRLMSDSIKDVSCLYSCLLCSWTGYQVHYWKRERCLLWWGLEVTFHLFWGDDVLLAPSTVDIWHTHKLFTAQCEISPKAMVPS